MESVLLKDYVRNDLSADMARLGTGEFPPLSQRRPPVEGQAMPSNSPADLRLPEKATPPPPGRDDEVHKEKKDLSSVVTNTETMINYGHKQVKQSLAITLELLLLLEHEQKMLQQIMVRLDKFKSLRQDNKQKATIWENEYHTKIPELDFYSKKLVNVPQHQNTSFDGEPTPVQQKILLQIVTKTSATANKVLIQLSMEETVANDIDLTLGTLKKRCTVMLKQIKARLKMLNTQWCNENIVLARWSEYQDTFRDLKNKYNTLSVEAGGGDSKKNFLQTLRPYDERLQALEDALCKLGGPSYGTCPPSLDAQITSGALKKDETPNKVDPSPTETDDTRLPDPRVSPNYNPLTSKQNNYAYRLQAVEEAINKIESLQKPSPYEERLQALEQVINKLEASQKPNPYEERLQAIEQLIYKLEQESRYTNPNQYMGYGNYDGLWHSGPEQQLYTGTAAAGEWWDLDPGQDDYNVANAYRR